MILRFSENAFINKRVNARAPAQPVEVYEEDGTVWFNYNDGDVLFIFAIEDLRAIMRLFDVAESDD